jgi:hypothetical protein
MEEARKGEGEEARPEEEEGGLSASRHDCRAAFGAKKTFADGRKLKSVWPYLFY